MPPLTRLFIKTALLYFGLALLMGLTLALRPIISLPPFMSALNPVYFHLFMLGWVTQLIFGVVYWMFPKQSKEKPHGSEGWWWATFWLLNVGLILRAISEPAMTINGGLFWGWTLALSAGLQWLAGMVFVLNTWGRVKER